MTRKIFLTLMIIFTILNVGYFELAIRRVNDVSDKYLDLIINNSIIIGCAIPTGNWNYCRTEVLTRAILLELPKDIKETKEIL